MISDRFHPTNFIIDFEPYDSGKKSSLIDFVEREPGGYDLAFCEAWEFSQTVKVGSLDIPEDLLAFLDRIQAISIKHLSKEIESRSTAVYGITDALIRKDRINVHGRVSQQAINGFFLVPGPCSDKEGIKELIDSIWNKKTTFYITAALGEEISYLLNNRTFAIIDNRSGRKLGLLEPTQENFEKIIDCYERYPSYDRQPPITLCNATDPKERERQVLRIFERYITQIKLDDSPEKKIQTIAITIRDIIQRHIYIDGNGRSSFFLANTLMKLNDLLPFYPRNMCMFEGNSVKTMVREVLLGQKRFSLMFKDATQLTEGLKVYCDAVSGLANLIEGNYPGLKPLKESFEKRDYNQLLRRSAVAPKYKALLQYLLDNRSALAVNIFSRGLGSGTVLDVALKNDNKDAIELLEATIRDFICNSNLFSL